MKKLIALIVILVIVIAGGVVLYNKLTKTNAPETTLSEDSVSTDTDDENGSDDAESSEVDEAGNSEEAVSESSKEVESESGKDAASKNSEDASEQEEEKYLAPDFTVYDADGNEVKLSDFAGKPVVLNFWASWCGPCKSEMPEFDDAYALYGEDVEFMMVNLTDGAKETEESAGEFISKEGYSFPVYYDTDVDATMTYGATSIPLSVFIDKDGYISDAFLGAISSDQLLSKIEKLIS